MTQILPKKKRLQIFAGGQQTLQAFSGQGDWLSYLSTRASSFPNSIVSLPPRIFFRVNPFIFRPGIVLKGKWKEEEGLQAGRVG